MDTLTFEALRVNVPDDGLPNWVTWCDSYDPEVQSNRHWNAFLDHCIAEATGLPVPPESKPEPEWLQEFDRAIEAGRQHRREQEEADREAAHWPFVHVGAVAEGMLCRLRPAVDAASAVVLDLPRHRQMLPLRARESRPGVRDTRGARLCARLEPAPGGRDQGGRIAPGRPIGLHGLETTRQDSPGATISRALRPSPQPIAAHRATAEAVSIGGLR